ncbi:MAG: hypothetical protein Q8908_09170 [Bacteroidota bacterium]|nr:hypothetical protein [Bacteroidota bacterium]
MKKKPVLFILPLLIIGFALILINSCSKGNGGNNKDSTTATVPQVTTNDVSNITNTTVDVSGVVVSDGGSPIQKSGFCWSAKPTPTIADSSNLNGSPTGTFTCTIQALAEGSPYYVRAYATNAVGTGYGPIKTFTTGMSCQTMVA